MPSRMIACSLALLAFAAAIVAGIAVGNPAITTLWRALLAMIASYAVGSAAGAVAEHALREHIEQYKRDHPLEAADRSPNDAGTSEVEASPPEAQEAPRDGARAPRSGAAGRASEEPTAADAGSSAAADEPAAA